MICVGGSSSRESLLTFKAGARVKYPVFSTLSAAKARTRAVEIFNLG
jgi:hypothetical protein